MRRNRTLLLNLILFVYLLIVFFGSMVLFSHFLSEGNIDLTTQMSKATLPVVHFDVNGISTNYLRGYVEPMDSAYMREALTVVDGDRRIDYTIETFGENIDSMLFEVRSIDGSRLVENTDISIYSKQGDEITGYITIKDLISNGDEYMLIFILQLRDGRSVRYYSRLVWSEDLHVEDKVAFVKDFSDRTFDKNDAVEIAKYLESDYTGDNSSYHYANIHSSFNQVTWGSLDISKLTQARVTVCELTPATGYFKLEYQVGIQEESGRATCNVTEYFRVRYTTDRIYLLGWERYCNQIPDENGDIFTGNQIELGICGDNIELVESDGGTNFAFVDEGKLIGVNPLEHKVSLIYSFYDEENITDLRSSYQGHSIHILNVDETGNVYFVVSGYMNRGINEGKVGIAVYSYNSTVNNIEEIAFIEYDRSPEILMADIKELSYIDRNGRIYFMLDRNVYQVETESNTLSVMAGALQDDAYKVSDSGSMLVWQGDENLHNCTKLRLMNLASGIGEDIKAGYGEYILPLGFMGEDLIYGLAHKKDVSRDIDGSIIFPMYKLVIRNADGEILKEYEEEDIYIMGCEFGDGLMNMTRTRFNSTTNTYEPVADDQIVSTVESLARENTVNKVVTDSLETVIQISMKDEISEEIIILTPKELIFEGSRELYRDQGDTSNRFYVYGLHGYMSSYMGVSNAVNCAYDNSGIVLDGTGKYIWYKTTRASKNQIMAITPPDKVEPEESLAVCVDAVLRFEGITTNSRVLLSQGQNVQQIFEDYMGEGKVLNLSGCNLDSVLYYVNKDIPVLAILNDSSAMLITGFNDSQVVVFDPIMGELRKESITDMDNRLRSNGYRFITYIQ